MLAYHFKKKAAKQSLSESMLMVDSEIVKKTVVFSSDIFEAMAIKNKQRPVVPFLQKRNHEFASPLSSYIKQRGLILDPTISRDDLKAALGIMALTRNEQRLELLDKANDLRRRHQVPARL